MTWLSEDPTLLLVAGIAVVAMLIAGIVKTGRGSLLWAILGVIAILAVLIIVERLWVTDRELVADRLDAAVASLEANDLEGTLAHISASATEMRGVVQFILPNVEIEDINLGDVQIAVNHMTAPPTATATFIALVQAKYRGQAPLYEKTPFRISVELQKEGDEWLFSRYEGPGAQGRPL